MLLMISFVMDGKCYRIIGNEGLILPENSIEEKCVQEVEVKGIDQ